VPGASALSITTGLLHWTESPGVDLDSSTERQPGDPNRCASWSVLAKGLGVGLVHGRELRDVDHEDARFDDVGQCCPVLLKKLAEVGDRLVQLRRDAASYQGPVLAADLAGH